MDIAKSGLVKITKPKITDSTVKRFINNTLLFYTGVSRSSAPILAAQDAQKVLDLKHQAKTIGQEVLRCFLKDDLDKFGRLMDEHWRIKKAMSADISNSNFDQVYNLAKSAGALGGKIIGAGGGGYFMFYCPAEPVKGRVRQALKKFNFREMNFGVDEKGARAETFYI